MFRGRPTCLANSGSMWIGLKSPRRARVAVRQVLVGRDLQLDRSRSDPPARCWSRCRARPPGRPGCATPTRRRRSPCPPFSEMSLTLVSVVITSPAQTGSPQTNSCAAVDHHREVDADLRVEDRRRHRAGRVDDREHRRRRHVAEARRLRLLAVEVDGVVLAHRVRVLADLLLAHLVLEGREGLADR